MKCHYQDLSNAFDWSCRKGNLFQPMKSTTQIRVVNVISLEFLRSLLRSFCMESSDGIVECRMFSQGIKYVI